MPDRLSPVLIVGGTGMAGSQTARTLRRLHQSLPIVIGGRDMSKASAIAAEIGNSAGTAIDLGRTDLGQPGDRPYSAVAVFLMDENLNTLRFAQDRKIPHISISSGLFELAPGITFFAHRPLASPVLIASQWLAGCAVLTALHLSRDFEQIDAIRIGAVADEQDMGGPAGMADWVRLSTVITSALVRKAGDFVWIRADAAKTSVRSVDGTQMEAQGVAALDVTSLAAATNASSVRFDLAIGATASRRRGAPFSTEVVIEIEGTKRNGQSTKARCEIVHPEGQRPLTALGAAIGIERMLGLGGGEAVAPGLYLPEILIEPSYFVSRMEQFGAQISWH